MSRALDIAHRQYGVITRAQALAAGVHRRSIDRLVGSGRWEIVARAVYRVSGSPRSWEQRALALVLSAGDEAVVSHRSAAHLYGLDGFGPTGRIDVTTSRHRRHTIVGATVHETTDPHLLSQRTRRGVPVTGPARTVLDVCWVVDDDLTALRALDEMLRHRLVTWEELWQCLVVHARRGRNGVARYRRILVKRWGKRSPHGELEDPVRENRLKLAGWLVLRYTWSRLIDEPNAIVDEVRDALLSRSCAA
jgi:predicted transcriptional regulator of viral defense system